MNVNMHNQVQKTKMKYMDRKMIFAAAVAGLLSFASVPADLHASDACTVAEKENTGVVSQIDKAQFLERIVDFEGNPDEWKYLGDKPAIVDFYAPWCGPCKRIAPILEELAAEYGGEIYIYKVNTDNEKELAAAFGITSIPSLLFIPVDGDPRMFKGALPKEELVSYIEKYLLGK